MNPKHIRQIQTNEVLRKRLAKYIALHCFRNTLLEDLHSGEVPISESGDYSDVKVVTPDREIPWSDLSRFDNREMKALMIDVVNHCDQVFAILFSTPAGDKLIEELVRRDLVPYWNDPEWAWGADHEPQIARDLPRRRLAGKPKVKKRETDKVRGRSAGRK
ncbi:MAG: hypothetical protein JO184_06620 [Gammaproteobacteria bacterium]|nr:hypothetical protein [Gammaproteobacteria bacterium]MBV8488441.1 hypothetical protein [Planctomycetaceae bacterium]